MSPKIRNIIIIAVVIVVLIAAYFFFSGSSSNQASLVSSPSTTQLPSINNQTPDTTIPTGGSLVAKDFLTLLLNVKGIKLDDSVFSDPAFNSLRDSSITLTPDGTEGRPNPFAQFGTDIVAMPPASTPNTPPNNPQPANP